MRTQRFEIEELSMLTEALQRYHYYLEAGIHADHIFQLQQEWLHNILALVPRDKYSCVSDATYHSMIELEIAEIRADFAQSMRKAIIDYLLKSRVERK